MPIGPKNSSRVALRPPPEPGVSHEPEVLTTWKDVARYMGKGVRTVQRWERDLALPVRRPPGARSRRIVVALAHDLDAWVALSCMRNRQNLPTVPSSELSRSVREHVRISMELRIANRMLLHEIRIATQALRQNLTALCPPPAANGEAPMNHEPLNPGGFASALPD